MLTQPERVRHANDCEFFFFNLIFLRLSKPRTSLHYLSRIIALFLSFLGTWTSDVAVTTSDRRLKKDIVPLRPGRDRDDQQGAGWIVRELRPVSFTLRGDSWEDEGQVGKRRFGFIAQVKTLGYLLQLKAWFEM